MTQVKRFIAGAVCPRCAAMDSVRMYRKDGREYRECVKCGFEDSLSLDGRPDPQEIDTRVNHESAPVAETQPLQFYPTPGKKH